MNKKVKTKAEKNRLNYLSAKKLPFETSKAKKSKSSFDWSYFGFVVLLALFFVSLRERALSGGYSTIEIQKTLDKLSKTTIENQLIFKDLASIYKEDNLENLGFEKPQREYVVSPSISRK